MISILIHTAQFFILKRLLFFLIEFLGFTIESSEIASHYLSEGTSSAHITLSISAIHISLLSQSRKSHREV